MQHKKKELMFGVVDCYNYHNLPVASMKESGGIETLLNPS